MRGLLPPRSPLHNPNLENINRETMEGTKYPEPCRAQKTLPNQAWSNALLSRHSPADKPLERACESEENGKLSSGGEGSHAAWLDKAWLLFKNPQHTRRAQLLFRVPQHTITRAGDECAARWPRTGRILAAKFSVACGLPLSALLLKGLPMRHPDGTAALTMSHNMTNGDEILCVARVQATSARGGGPGLGASWRRSSRSCAARRCRCRCSWAYLPTRHPDGTAALTMSHTADSDEDPLRCACAGDECARQWPRTGPILAAQFSVACGLPLTALLLKGLPTAPPGRRGRARIGSHD